MWFFHRHKWGKWVDVSMVERYVLWGRPMSDWTPFDAQQRTCETCGVTQRRRI